MSIGIRWDRNIIQTILIGLLSIALLVNSFATYRVAHRVREVSERHDGDMRIVTDHIKRLHDHLHDQIDILKRGEIAK